MSKQVFVARERELGQLNEFLDRTLAGQGQVCFVTGEAGAGMSADFYAHRLGFKTVHLT